MCSEQDTLQRVADIAGVPVTSVTMEYRTGQTQVLIHVDENYSPLICNIIADTLKELKLAPFMVVIVCGATVRAKVVYNMEGKLLTEYYNEEVDK
jgi:hypothetical protein